MTVDEWIDANIAADGDLPVRVVRDTIERVRRHGGEAYVTPSETQLSLRLPAKSDKDTVVALEVKSNPASLCLPLGRLQAVPPFTEEDNRVALHERLGSVTGTLSSDNPRGYPTFPVDRLDDGDAASRFGDFVDDLATSLERGEVVSQPSEEAGTDPVPETIQSTDAIEDVESVKHVAPDLPPAPAVMEPRAEPLPAAATAAADQATPKHRRGGFLGQISGALARLTGKMSGRR